MQLHLQSCPQSPLGRKCASPSRVFDLKKKLHVQSDSRVSDLKKKLSVQSDKLRHSPRLQAHNEGFKHSSLVDTPRKRARGQKKQNVTSTTDVEEVAEQIQSPFPTPVLQEWGIDVVQLLRSCPRPC
jgi:hypothetical protein